MKGMIRKMQKCLNCQQPLTDGALTLPWEDGNNPLAYVECPICGYKNDVYGFGEDD